jgi:hypothetical protein
VKARSPLISQPDEVQAAQNAFAVAIKNHTQNPNPETLKARDEAEAKLYEIQDAYREGRKRRYLKALELREQARGA